MPPTRGRHTLVNNAIRRLKRDGSELSIGASDIEALRDELLGLASAADLLEAARQLGTFAYFLEVHEKSPRAAKAVLEIVIAGAERLKAMGAAGEQVAEDARHAAERLKQLTGDGPKGPGLPGPAPSKGFGVGLRRR